MAHAAASPTEPALADHVTPAATTAVQHPPVTPGKVAMWLFLATEIMFFTGLIGSYIVLRAGSPADGLQQPLPARHRPHRPCSGHQGRPILTSAGADHEKVVEILQNAAGLTEHEAEHLLDELPHAVDQRPDSRPRPRRSTTTLEAAGAEAEVEPLKTYNWPLPYDELTNPLSIDLTAVNTFILICSSVTMVLALAAIQRGDTAKCTVFLLATVLIGSTLPGRPGLRILSADGRPPLPARHQRRPATSGRA